MAGNYRLIGKDFTPPDVYGKVTGQARYAEDFRAEGMLFAKLLLSPMPHGRVRRLDVSRAQRMNGVVAILEENRDNIAEALPGLAKFQITLGETIGNGPYYQAYIPNIFFGQLFQPWLDYAFGFRRGVNAGQPPDNAGPRAELPFPYNGIPEPWERWGEPPR